MNKSHMFYKSPLEIKTKKYNSIKKSTLYTLKYNKEIPYFAYFHFLHEDDIYKKEYNPITKSNKERRIVFGIKSKLYSPFERSEIENIKGQLRLDNSLLIDKDDEILKCLQFNKWKIGKTLNDLSLIEKKRKEKDYICSKYISDNENIINDILNSKAFYIFGRDEYLRPNLYIEEKYLKNIIEKYPLISILNSLLFIIDYIVNNLLIPGQIESFNIIIKEIDILISKYSKGFLDYIFTYSILYRYRVNSLIIYSKNYLSIQTLKYYMNYEKYEETSYITNIYDTYNINLIIISNTVELWKQLDLFIHKDQRIKKFGGNAFLNRILYPPMQISSNYYVNRIPNSISPELFFKRIDECDLVYGITKEIEALLRRSNDKEAKEDSNNDEYLENIDCNFDY